jgi:hypothetical protein
MMIVVIISAVFMAVWNLVPRAIDPLLNDRVGTIPALWVGRGVARYFWVVSVVTAVVASPFVVAIVLALKASSKGRTWRTEAVRWLGVAASLAIGLAILNYPLDGMRIAWLMREGYGVCFYHQYRFWPGEHITPCLELVTPSGRSRSYPIAKNLRYQELPDLRSNAEQTILWLVDSPSARVRHGGVWCSINRRTGEFVGAGGTHPEGVTESSGAAKMGRD